MKLSAFTVVDAYPTSVTGPRDRLREVVSLAEAAEGAGLTALWIAEHHFHDGGVCPSPPVLLAACGERTRRLRLGVLVSVLPFHAPVELAEQYGMVDRLLGGRLNLGLGSGYIPLEFEGHGVDPSQKRPLFDRAYDTVLAALRGEPVASDGSTTSVRINVRPVQTPTPPIWIAVQRREAIPFVARRGVSVALVPYATLDSVDELADEVREFRADLPSGASASVSAAIHIYAGPNVPRAREALQRYLDSRLSTQSAFLAAKVAKDPAHGRAETLESHGFALLGEASEVAGRLAEYRRAGVDEVLGIFDFGGLPVEDVRASVEALGREFQP